MNSKWVSSVAVAVLSVLAIVLIILKQYDWAVFSMTVMFAVSNIFRAKSFEEDDYVREAKWMKWMGIFFAVLSVGVLVVIFKS